MARYLNANGAIAGVGTLTHREIKIWLDSLRVQLGDRAVGQISSTYEQHHHSYLSQFFRWCRKKYGTPRDNPCESITIQGVTADPEVFNVEECEKILKLSLTDQFVELLPFHAICIFAGVRVKECERLTWKEIDFDDGCVVLMGGTAKTQEISRERTDSRRLRTKGKIISACIGDLET